jgi:pimeloyl-ACP methyl ester carboxylesterase
VPIAPDHATLPSLTCVTPDGVELAVYDFGGAGPDLLFVHATGFCAGVLLPLAQRLADRFRCHALDLRGHGRSGRPPDGDYSWSGFGVDVLAVVDRLGLEAPSGFGHSCGGASLLLAEQARHGTFRSLYLYEPVVVPTHVGPAPVEENPLSRGARRRRESFPSAEDAFVNFSSKPPFGDLDPEVLRRYVEDGFEVVPESDGGDGSSVRLRCRRDDEAEVYLHGFYNGAFQRLPEVRCPTVFAHGRETDAFGEEVMAADAQRVQRGSVETFADIGHFGPLQDPATVAPRIARSLSAPDGTPPS